MRRKNICNPRTVAPVCLAAAASLVIGYQLGARRDEAGAYLETGSIPSADYYCSEPSFSEVENTKAALDGLCRRFRTEIQQTRVTDQQFGNPSSTRLPGTEPHLDHAIAGLERGLQEFAGTRQQGEIAQDLLLALKKAKRFDRWVEVYLTLLYEQPTHPNVAHLADEALNVAKLCGREREVVAGLEHLQDIPSSFGASVEVQTVLAHVKTPFAAVEPGAVEK